MKYLAIIQARLTSTRFPNKVMQLVGGKTMLRRVWDAAKGCKQIDRVVVAWPERFPDIPEDDVYSKFVSLINEFNPKYIVRLTADCPLLKTVHIKNAIEMFEECLQYGDQYYNNGMDGYDVQIFTPQFMYSHRNKEHVLDVEYNYNGDSVNTPADLERVRQYAR
jgi:spore coat polysaccharide biosynthesis protein SpsF (cytidylyltransferase family)